MFIILTVYIVVHTQLATKRDSFTDFEHKITDYKTKYITYMTGISYTFTN